MSLLRSFFRILARNIMFLGGGRGSTPEELDERDDYRRRSCDAPAWGEAFLVATCGCR